MPFLDLVKACILGPWISPLINGRPGPSFQSSQGLRQGCPLCPSLFILMVESFSKALDYNQRIGLITGIKFGNGVKNLSIGQEASLILRDERREKWFKRISEDFGQNFIWGIAKRNRPKSGERWKSILFMEEGKMGGVGETSSYTLALGLFHHLNKVFFYYSPISSVEADGETIWARSLV